MERLSRRKLKERLCRRKWKERLCRRKWKERLCKRKLKERLSEVWERKSEKVSFPRIFFSYTGIYVMLRFMYSYRIVRWCWTCLNMLAIIALRYKNAIIIWLNKEICNVAACVQGFFLYIHIKDTCIHCTRTHSVHLQHYRNQKVRGWLIYIWGKE